MTGTRHLIAGVVLYAIARLRGAPKPQPKHWLAAASVGALLLLSAMARFPGAKQVLPSSVAALLVATVSLWMIIVEWLRPGGHRPTLRIATGLAFGFLGVVILVSPRTPFFSTESAAVNPVAAVTLVLGSLMWAIGSILSRHLELPSSPLLATAMIALTGGTLLWMVGLIGGEGADLHLHRVTLRSALALAYLSGFRIHHRFDRLHVYSAQRSALACLHVCVRQPGRGCVPGLGGGGRTDHARECSLLPR